MDADPQAVLLAALIGVLVGTLADPIVDRFYADPLLYSPFGRCTRCNTHLLPFGAIALVGYIRWRGRCPHCHTRFPLRSLLLPLATAGFFALAAIAYDDDTRRALLTMTFGVFALLFIVTDTERRVLPNWFLYPALGLAIVLAPLWPHNEPLNMYMTGAGVLAAALSIRLLFGVAVGFGDVKLAALVGLTLGVPEALIATAVTAIAALGAVIVVAADRGRPSRALPYGSLLAIGMGFSLLWAEPVLRSI